MSIEAVGALWGSLLAARIRKKVGIPTAILIALGIAAIGNLVIGVTSDVLIVATMLVIIPFAGGLWNVVTGSLRQRMVPDRLLGRVQSAHRMLAWGAIPIGTLLGGVIARVAGLRAPFIIAAVTLGILSLVAARVTQRTYSNGIVLETVDAPA